MIDPEVTIERLAYLKRRWDPENIYFVDDNVLNGFQYYYAVTSFASRNPRLGLPELESGFNENAREVVPGGPAGGGPTREPVGVYPTPYRAASLFDTRRPGGEPAATGVLKVNGDMGNLVGGATVPAQRRKGCQVALLQRRLYEAGRLGCAVVYSGGAYGSSSLRNQHRAGLRIAYIESGWKKGPA